MVTLPAWLIVAFIIPSHSMNSIAVASKIKGRVLRSKKLGL